MNKPLVFPVIPATDPSAAPPTMGDSGNGIAPVGAAPMKDHPPFTDPCGRLITPAMNATTGLVDHHVGGTDAQGAPLVGFTLSFPAGTPQDVIAAALGSHYWTPPAGGTCPGQGPPPP